MIIAFNKELHQKVILLSSDKARFPDLSTSSKKPALQELEILQMLLFRYVKEVVHGMDSSL